jgi:phosphate-selective porin
VLLALLLALTMDPPASDSAVTTTTTATTTTTTTTAASVTAAPSQGVGLVLPKVLPKEEPSRALRFVWRDHPSLRGGRNFRVDFSVKVQEDARDPGDDPIDFPTWELHRLRVGVDGEVFRKIQFSVEREFSENLNNDPTRKSTKSQWKDVYAELNAADWLQIRGGQFKIPYGLDQTSGETNLDFIYRSLGGDYLSPGRDVGGEVHGRFFQRGLNYWVGGFRHDGQNSRSSRDVGNEEVTVGEAGFTMAGRVTGLVLRKAGPTFLKGTALSGSYAQGSVSDKGFLPNGLRGRTVVTQHTFFERMFVKGPRQRYGTDVEWASGPVGARAEYMFVTDARQQQGLGDENLSDIRYKAWYVYGVWVVTREPLAYPVEPRKGGIGLGGWGALELTARFDKLGVDSKQGQDPPFRNTRAETVFPSFDSVWTAGFTYRANRWVKIQGNAIHETLSDIERAPKEADTDIPIPKYWSYVLRFQFEI